MCGIGVELAAERRWDEAVPAFTHVLAHLPDSAGTDRAIATAAARVHHARAVCLQNLRRLPESLSDLDIACALARQSDQDSSAYRQRRGEVQLQLGRRAGRVERALAEELGADLQRVGAMRSMDWFHGAALDAGAVLETEPGHGRLNSPARDLLRSVQLKLCVPQLVGDAWEAAEQLWCRRSWPEAAGAYTQVLRHLRNFRMNCNELPSSESSQLLPASYYHCKRGQCYGKLHRWQEALRDFDMAVRLEPSEQRHWQQRAGANRQLGRAAEADADTAQSIALGAARLVGFQSAFTARLPGQAESGDGGWSPRAERSSDSRHVRQDEGPGAGRRKLGSPSRKSRVERPKTSTHVRDQLMERPPSPLLQPLPTPEDSYHAVLAELPAGLRRMQKKQRQTIQMELAQMDSVLLERGRVCNELGLGLAELTREMQQARQQAVALRATQRSVATAIAGMEAELSICRGKVSIDRKTRVPARLPARHVMFVRLRRVSLLIGGRCAGQARARRTLRFKDRPEEARRDIQLGVRTTHQPLAHLPRNHNHTHKHI